MSFDFGEKLRVAFAPPRYIALPFAGVDLSTSGVKAMRLTQGSQGLTLASYAAVRLPSGAFTDGEIVNHAAVVEALVTAAKMVDVSAASAALPESKSYLFTSAAPGALKSKWRVAIEQRLDELVPLPPPETAFDIVGVGQSRQGETLVAGVGFARRIVDDTLSVFDEANIEVRSLEGEPFAMARALIPTGDTSTVLIIDVGKTTTKMAIVVGRIPLFATTISIGGHALTLAVQKHFGVTEAEARKVKTEHGIVPAPGNEDYLAAMLSTVSAIRDEISHRLEYWQEKGVLSGAPEPGSRGILAGGNAPGRGPPENF